MFRHYRLLALWATYQELFAFCSYLCVHKYSVVLSFVYMQVILYQCHQLFMLHQIRDDSTLAIPTFAPYPHTCLVITARKLDVGGRWSHIQEYFSFKSCKCKFVLWGQNSLCHQICKSPDIHRIKTQMIYYKLGMDISPRACSIQYECITLVTCTSMNSRETVRSFLLNSWRNCNLIQYDSFTSW